MYTSWCTQLQRHRHPCAIAQNRDLLVIHETVGIWEDRERRAAISQICNSYNAIDALWDHVRIAYRHFCGLVQQSVGALQDVNERH